MKYIRRLLSLLILLAFTWIGSQPAWAFCGFYVAKADASLYNQASQVIIARNGNRTVLTMANDYQGEVKDFALVVPVPVILQQEQVHIGDATILERLDSFSAPRLVEYFDADPCQIQVFDDALPSASAPREEAEMKGGQRNALGVTVEEEFTVGEYDILILSAKESDGLATWLRQNNYKIPRGAKEILQPYIKQKMKFFVAKVNLEEFSKTGFKSLRPLMMAYESPKFMLPIRLGMVNAQGAQDLIVYLLSPQGQTELTNYRTVQIPSNMNLPEFVQEEFSDFYKAMFERSYTQESKKVGFLEYAWDMSSCDPCSAEPLNQEELKKAGVFWLDSDYRVFITRLHVRYTRDKFPQDLQFLETGNRQFFQGRYVMQHPYRGEMTCRAAETYQQSVRERQENEAQTLAKLTGWDLHEIRSKIDFMEVKPVPWWRRLWNQFWSLW
jgi:hypothetical protein